MTGTAIRAAILADGGGTDRPALDAAWPGWADDLGLVIAADGGARLATGLGLAIDAWVGDADSIGEAELLGLIESGVDVTRVEATKDESDTELAVMAAIERGATDLTILGGLGGRRFDHALANVALLGHPILVGRTARLLDPGARVSLVVAPGPDGGPVTRALAGRVGDAVSLLPLGRVDGITTEGLEYPLRDEPLLVGPARGLSNVRRAADASVRVRRGHLVIVETPLAILSP